MDSPIWLFPNPAVLGRQAIFTGFERAQAVPRKPEMSPPVPVTLRGFMHAQYLSNHPVLTSVNINY
jgi:hypothetical protein